MFKKNDTLRNVLLAGLACVALIFASCNQAVDDGNGNYVNLNDGEPVTYAYAADAILNQSGGTLYAKISNEGLDSVNGEAALKLIADAMKTNSSVMVELDLSEIWHDDGVTKDAFGGLVEPGTDIATEPGSRQIGDPNTGVVKQGIFNGLKNLVSINLPFTVGTIDNNAFAECENLETVTINFFFVNDVAKLNKYHTEYMFDDVFMLKIIGDNAFDGCKNLKDFVLVSDPDNDDVDRGFPVSVQEIGDYAFRNCYSLESVRFLNTRNGGTAVSYGTPETAVTALPPYYVDSDGVSRNTLDNYTAAAENIEGYTTETDFDDIAAEVGLVKIGNGAFQNCKGITELDFTNKTLFKKGSVAVADLVAGSGVQALTDGDPNAGERTGAAIAADDPAIPDSAFDGCENLETIYFGQKSTADVEGYTRYNIAGSAGTELYPAGVANPAFTKYGNYAFQRTKLASETVAALLHASDAILTAAGTADNIDVVVFIGDRAFFGDEALEYVRLPSTITYGTGFTSDADATNLGAGAFANTGVQYIELHQGSDFLSITPDFLARTDINWADDFPGVRPMLEKYWKGALIGGNVNYGSADPMVFPDYKDAATFPTDIVFWKVIDSESEGNLAYLPKEESQNPRTKILGAELINIWPDAFYKNVDVTSIMLPNGLMDDTKPGIGNYAFANAENLEYVGFEGDVLGAATESWADGNQGLAAFANVPAKEADLVLTQTKGKLNK